ncbi:unnamed protein product [Menidia menidia]|uniref:(Atlantic silverside) hypothetical protein n=1 Tax=Menidia menidia TaxID=238744 RepID=A0A8S4ADF9_9TELE|nr:unnamed protein product [Menidia menidia]
MEPEQQELKPALDSRSSALRCHLLVVVLWPPLWALPPPGCVFSAPLESDCPPPLQVWTGLRFLAGEWLWVGGAELLYGGLPACPPPGQHCGVLLKDSGGLEPRDCSERKNFLCYKR